MASSLVHLGSRWSWAPLIAALAVVTAGPVRAQYSWNNAGGGNWSVGGNWNPAGPPGAADSATIDLAGAYTVTLSDDRSITNLTLNNATATLSHSSGTLTLGGTITLTSGLYTLGSAVISGGSITSGGGTLQGTTLGSRLNNVTIGNGVLDFGTAFRSVLLQGTSNFGAGATINLSANSTALGFEQTVTHDNLNINLTAANSIVEVNGNHTVTFGASSVITNSTASGTNEIGSDNFVAGTSVVQNQGLIRNTGAGQLTINADTFRNQSGGIVRATAGTLVITSPGEINQTGGTFDVNGGTLTLGGTNWDNNGTITLSSGTLNLGGTFATANIGTVNRTGGAVQITGTMDNASATLALNAATGSYVLGTTLTSPVTTGIITGGSITSADGSTLRVGPSPNNRLQDVQVGVGVLDFSINSGRVRLQGTTALAAGTTLDLNGGLNILMLNLTATLNDLAVNHSSGSGAVTVEGSNTITLGSNVTITSSAGGQINGTGTVVHQGTMLNTGVGLYDVRVGTFTNSGTLRATNGTVRVAGVVNFTNFDSGTGTLTGGTYLAHNATINFDGRAVTTLAAGTTVEISGASGSFVALNTLTTNAGTLRVLGGQSFNPSSSTTIANTGDVEVGSTGTLTSDLTVNGGGSLRGGGTVAGNVTYDTTGGTLAPGLSTGVGTLRATGNVSLNGNTTLAIRLNGSTAGSGYDQLRVDGTLNLNNAVLDLSLGYSPGGGDLLFILNKTSAGAIPDTFFNRPEGSTVTVGGYTATLSYLGDFDSNTVGGGNDVVLSNFTPVPEPSSLLAVTAGGWASFLLARRRNRTRS